LKFRKNVKSVVARVRAASAGEIAIESGGMAAKGDQGRGDRRRPVTRSFLDPRLSPGERETDGLVARRSPRSVDASRFFFSGKASRRITVRDLRDRHLLEVDGNGNLPDEITRSLTSRGERAAGFTALIAATKLRRSDPFAPRSD
jgi:hypothetical protein